LFDFNQKFRKYQTNFSEVQNTYFHEYLSGVQSELFHVDKEACGLTDRRGQNPKIHSANAPKKILASVADRKINAICRCRSCTSKRRE